MYIPDNRTRSILGYLVESPHPVSSRRIADDLRLTPRQVRYSLIRIDAWLRSKNMSVEKKQGVGIQILGSSSQIQTVKEELAAVKNRPSFLPQKSRVDYILLSLFFQKAPLVTKKLGFELCTSRSTINRDKKFVRDKLENCGIKLIGKPNYGLIISGEESRIRKAFSKIILEAIGEEELLNMIFIGDNKGKIEERIYRKYPFAVGADLTNFLVENVPEFSRLFYHRLGKKISDNACLKLAIIANVSVFRIKLSSFIQKTTREEGVARFSSIAEEILSSHTQVEDQQIITREITFLTRQIEQMTSDRLLSEDVNPVRIKEKTLPVQDITLEILSVASKKLHPSLMVNAELKKNIHSIIYASCNEKNDFGIAGQNLKGRISSHYPLVNQTAETIQEELGRKFGYSMPDAVLENLAICLVAAVQKLQGKHVIPRVLLVCNAGSITAWLLESRIRSEFPRLEIAGKSSVINLKGRKDLKDIDLIISTIDLEGIKIPQIKVDPLLEADDIQRIQNMILEIESSESFLGQHSRGVIETVELRELLTEKTILINETAGDWQEAVEIAGQPLVKLGKVEDRFISAMKKVIFKNGPYMVLWPGIALLHADSNSGVRELGMSMATLQKPIPFGHEKNDPVDVVLVIAAIDNYSHYHSLEQLLSLINDPEKLKLIRNARQAKEIIDLL